jgi:hypothetical protein
MRRAEWRPILVPQKCLNSEPSSGAAAHRPLFLAVAVVAKKRARRVCGGAREGESHRLHWALEIDRRSGFAIADYKKFGIYKAGSRS